MNEEEKKEFVKRVKEGLEKSRNACPVCRTQLEEYSLGKKCPECGYKIHLNKNMRCPEIKCVC